MGLSFARKEPIDFGGRKCTFKPLTTEAKLRVNSAERNATSEESIRTIAECFDEKDRDYVEKFLKEEMTEKGIVKVATYLVGGEDAVNDLEKAYETAIKEAIKNAND